MVNQSLYYMIQYLEPNTKSRGVQYVHWVMHKCIMAKVGGKNTQKVCKKLLNFLKTGGEICESRGGNENFCQSGGKCTKRGKIIGEIQNLWSMTKKKKGHQKFWGMKIGNFFGKR